ncbi:MAG: hypothetical protein K2M47_02920 [Clostridiales bacterium]|nr:hypothetical protein [Clostridiales bacterium]
MGFARINLLCSAYSEIAIENYFLAKERIEQIKREQDYSYGIEYYDDAVHPTFITCVFAIMAIESYLNDYAAKNLGDEEFYDNFDKLSLLSKFQLISKFILRTDVDKSQSYYGNLKTAEKMRNEFVHNKSRDLSKWLNGTGFFVDNDLDESEFDEEYELNKLIHGFNDNLKKAKTAIESMRDIAYFFENNDKNCCAFLLLFPQLMIIPKSPSSEEIKKEFSIKI